MHEFRQIKLLGSGVESAYGVRLIPLKKDDLDGLFQVASDPEIWVQHPDSLRYTSEVFNPFFYGAFGDNMEACLVIHEMSGEIMGSSRYYRIDPVSDTAFIGYTFLARKWWGGYWNSCLKLIMLDLAFQKLKSVYFEAAASNLRSVSALRKLGAEEISHPVEGKALFQISNLSWPDIRAGLNARIAQ
jgi:RimJ/RimL family protein N-acetyltransferase